MDYYCFRCRETHHGNTLKRRRCVRCRGRLVRSRGGIPVRRVTSMKELVARRDSMSL
jgi:hypothetical protein